LPEKKDAKVSAVAASSAAAKVPAVAASPAALDRATVRGGFQDTYRHFKVGDKVTIVDTWSGLEDLISLEGGIHRIFLKNRFFFLMRMDGIENDENMQLSKAESGAASGSGKCAADEEDSESGAASG